MKINNKSNSVGKFTYKDTSKDYLICEIFFFLVTNEIHTKCLYLDEKSRILLENKKPTISREKKKNNILGKLLRGNFKTPPIRYKIALEK